jgi:hypothetical protein
MAALPDFYIRANPSLVDVREENARCRKAQISVSVFLFLPVIFSSDVFDGFHLRPFHMIFFAGFTYFR